jgi:ribonuclease HIII
VKVIPLTHVAGTVDSPRVDISPQALASLGAREEFYRKRGDISREIDERLGEGSGKAVTDVLEGFLKK